MPEERKLVTVLFADFVGSTALGEAEDPELVRRTFGRAFAHIREQLEAHAAARQSYAEFLIAHGRAAEARPLLERVRDFYAHPFVAKRRARAEELLRQCDEVAAR